MIPINDKPTKAVNHIMRNLRAQGLEPFIDSTGTLAYYIRWY